MIGSYVKNDIQKFMEKTYYMMGIVDEFMDISDASSYGEFRDDELRIFRKMHQEMHDIIERRQKYSNK